jgi:hypothetical protein
MLAAYPAAIFVAEAVPGFQRYRRNVGVATSFSPGRSS